MSDPYFATGYVRLLYRLVRAEGVSAAALFADTSLCEADIMRADIEVPFLAQMRFCQNALAHSTPGLGLRVGNQLQLAAHGALGTAMQSAADLRAALTAFGQLIAVRASFFSLTLSELGSEFGSDSGEMTTITIEVSDLPKGLIAFFSESILFTLTHCLAFYTGHRDNLNTIRLAYPAPTYGINYGVVFGAPVEFGCAKTEFVFNTGLLSEPSPEADSISFAESIRRCNQKLDQHRVDDDIARSVESFLLDNPGKLWTLDEVSPLFAMSRRTLIRRLKDGDTTYQQLRDDVLKRQAAIYLSSMSVETAAISLGFADTSSFRRTFKRWFGVTPSAFVGTIRS